MKYAGRIDNNTNNHEPARTCRAAFASAAVAVAIAGLGAFGTAVAAPADEVIGYVKTVTPEASVWYDGKAVIAQPGTALRTGSVLRTGKAGSIGVTFKDNTIVSIGPDTEVSVDDYLYDPARGDLKLGATFSKGSLYYVSGVIAKLKPEAVAIKTPTGTIGVRGTRFVARVDAADEQPAAGAR